LISRWRLRLRAKAKAQGLVDGQGRKLLTLKTGDTIAEQSWNAGAVVSHMAAVKLDIDENLTRIAAESDRDPVAYKEKAKAYSSGLIENLDPSLQPGVQDEVSQTILDKLQVIEEDERTFIREQQTENTLGAIDAYETEALNQALSGELDKALAAQEKSSLFIDTAEATGLITPKVAETRRKAINRNIEVEMIKGEFTRQMKAGGARKFLDLFAKQKAISDFTPDDRRKLQKELIGMMGKEQQLEADALKAERDARKERWRRGLRKVSLLRASGELTADTLSEMVKNDQLDPDDESKFRSGALRGGPEVSDGMVINLFREDLLNVSDADIWASGDLTDKDKQTLIEEKQTLEDDLGNWRNTQTGREGTRRINEAFGIKAGVDTRPSAEKVRQAGNVLTRYFDEVESLPLEERGIKSLEIANTLVRQVRGEDTDNAITKARQKLEDLPFKSEEEIDASDLGSAEKHAAKGILIRKQRRLERLEAERAKLN